MRRVLLIAGLVVAGLWVAGLFWFATSMPDALDDQGTATEAIVVLTGGSERLSTGLDLLREGKAKKLFVSGVDKSVSLATLMGSLGLSRDDFAGRITIGHVAEDTIGNAYETAIWLDTEGFTSFRLVTAAYHMRRSLMEMRNAMPHAAIVPHPVFPEGVKQGEWWRWPGTTSLIAKEYSKYLLAHLRHWLQVLTD